MEPKGGRDLGGGGPLERLDYERKQDPHFFPEVSWLVSPSY